MAERELRDVAPGAPALDDHVQELVEAERGMGEQGVRRAWQAADSDRVVLVSNAGGVRISRDNGTTPPAQVIVDGTPAGGHLGGTYPDPQLTTAILDLIVPPGTIAAYGGATPPAGWLACNGIAVSQAAYPKLYAVLGATYGPATGGTFTLPDLRGRVPLGFSVAHPIGTVGGQETVAGPAHTHPGSHGHALTATHTHGPGLHTHPPGGHTHPPGGHTHPQGSHTHGLTDHAHLGGAHIHSLNGHTHNVDHDHLNAVGAAAASPTGTNSILNGTGTATSVPAANHVHPVDLPALGAVQSGTPSVSNSDVASGSTGLLTAAASTGAPTAADTGAPSASATGAPSASDTGTPSAADTGTVTGTPSTATDATAPAASYPGSVATMPPFGAVTFIIRVGA